MTTPAGESLSVETTTEGQQTSGVLNDGHGDAPASTEVVTPARPTRQLWSEITDDEDYEGDSEEVRSRLARYTIKRQQEQTQAAAKTAEVSRPLARTSRRDRGPPRDNRNRLTQDLAIWNAAASNKPNIDKGAMPTPEVKVSMDRKARLGGLRTLSALLSGESCARKTTDLPPEKPAAAVSPGTPTTVASLSEEQADTPSTIKSQDQCDSSHTSETPSIDCTPMASAPSPQQDGQQPLVASLTNVDGDVIFHEIFDIWYTNPEALKRKGVNKEAYAGAMQKVGSFKRLSDFYEFHNALDWDAIREGSIIAYCRQGITPQWEDPANEQGGRYLVKNFNRNETESIFTKIALGFFAGMLHDWADYNAVSLHVRSPARGTSIQLWRRVSATSSKLTTARVKSDIFAFVDAQVAGCGLSVGWVPNRESLERNDSRLQNALGRRAMRRHDAYSRESPTESGGYKSIDDHPVHQLFRDKGKFKLSAEERRRVAALAAAESNARCAEGAEADGESWLEARSTSDSLSQPSSVASQKRTQDPYPDYDMPVQGAAYNYGKQKLMGEGPLEANTWAAVPVEVWTAGGAPPDAVYLDPYGQPRSFPGNAEEWSQYCLWQQSAQMQRW